MDHIQFNMQMKIGWRDLTEQIPECTVLLQQIPHQIKVELRSGASSRISAHNICVNIYKKIGTGFLPLLHHWCGGKNACQKGLCAYVMGSCSAPAPRLSIRITLPRFDSGDQGRGRLISEVLHKITSLLNPAAKELSQLIGRYCRMLGWTYTGASCSVLKMPLTTLQLQ